MSMGDGRMGVAAKRRAAAFAVATAAVAAVAGCSPGGGSAGAPAARIVVSPSTSSTVFDTPESTIISGLPADARVTVTASAPDNDGRAWTSSAVFAANGAGRVSLSQPSIGGSYKGSDEMGLVETLAPPAGVQGVYEPGTGGFDIALRASVAGHVVGATTMVRQWPTLKPKAETLAATGVYGELYLPAHSSGPRPAVLVFGGSEGGLAIGQQARQLAAQGYPALAVAYFKEPGLPSTLNGIPLEYFVKALKLLAKQPGVDPNHLLVWGSSRGSEAALLLGAHFPDLVHGVIAGVPSSVVWGGYPDSGSAAWTLDGKPLPYTPDADWNQPDPADAQDAVIPVEQIRGPVFMVCGGADQVWASCPFTDAIAARLASHHFAYPVTALHYPSAGHFGGDLMPYLPAADAAGPTAPAPDGGTELADQQAEAASWPRLVAFLGQQ